VLLPTTDGHGQLAFMGAPSAVAHVHDPLYGTSLSLPPYDYHPEFHPEYHPEYHHPHAAHMPPPAMLAPTTPIGSYYEVRTPAQPAPPHHPPAHQAPSRPPLVPSLPGALLHQQPSMAALNRGLPAPYPVAGHYGAPPLPSAPVEHASAMACPPMPPPPSPPCMGQPITFAPAEALTMAPNAAPPPGQPGAQNERHRVKAALDLLTFGQSAASQPGTPPHPLV